MPEYVSVIFCFKIWNIDSRREPEKIAVRRNSVPSPSVWCSVLWGVKEERVRRQAGAGRGVPGPMQARARHPQGN